MKRDLKTLNLEGIQPRNTALHDAENLELARNVMASNERAIKMVKAEAKNYSRDRHFSSGLSEESLYVSYMSENGIEVLTLDEAITEASRKKPKNNLILDGVVSDWIKSNQIKPLDGAWLMPQLLAYFGRLDLPPVNSEGLYDVFDFIRLNRSPEFFGYVALAKYPRRSEFLTTQTLQPSNAYSNLVPLVLAGLRKFKGIPYSKWGRSNLNAIVTNDLADFMLAPPVKATKNAIMAVREDARIVKTGASKGTIRPIKSMSRVYGTYDIFTNDTPTLQKLAVLQVWCAAPEYRHKYMVLDSVNWDLMPEALVDINLLFAGTSFTHNASDSPWVDTLVAEQEQAPF